MILMYTGDEILALSDRPTMVNFGYAVEPNDIKVNYTGRLAAKFLRSFFPESGEVIVGTYRNGWKMG